MAKKPVVPEVDPTEAEDGKASVILRGGPCEGAFDVLPDGTEVDRNELRVPAPGVMAVYQRKKAEGGLPTFRHVRDEPVYAVET